MIGGLLGCKGDAYIGEKKLDINQAYEIHRRQTDNFKGHKIDFLFAVIIPEINETMGMAKAMSETEIPYIIIFMIMPGDFISKYSDEFYQFIIHTSDNFW